MPNMVIHMPPKIKRKLTPPRPRQKVWNFQDRQTCSRFQEVFKAHVLAVETEAATTIEEIGVKIKTCVLKAQQSRTDCEVKPVGGKRK